MPEPRELTKRQIWTTIDDHRRAASAAIEAGADGVEVHAANGYLAHQFLSRNANLRHDLYGGSPLRRIRFAFELIRAVSEEIGADRTGVIISPGNPLNDIVEDDAEVIYQVLLRALSPLGLAYLNVGHKGNEDLLKLIRANWPGVLFLNRSDADLKTRIRDLEAN